MSAAVYAAVTGRILAALESGVVPWRKPWYMTRPPINAESKRGYRGINLFLLSLAPYTDHRWLTFRQAKALGGNVRKGEKASIVTFWKEWEVPRSDDKDPPGRKIPLLRTYLVFNIEQCEGLNVEPLSYTPRATAQRVEEADMVVRNMPDPPTFREFGDRAYYDPERDLVSIPKMERFRTRDDYYATCFHELGHSTGHPRRLARAGVTGEIQFGSAEYSREELVAELCSAFCCSAIGLDNSVLDNAVSYISGWLKVLRADSRAIVIAASQAQRAADYIRGEVPAVAP